MHRKCELSGFGGTNGFFLAGLSGTITPVTGT